MRKALVCSLLLASLPAVAGVYRWTDDKGVVHYSDAAPSPTAKPADLPALQTFDSKSLAKGAPVGSVGSSSDTQAAAPAAAPAASTGSRPVITSPENEATLRDTSGQITVSVNAPDGSSLVYYLDGTAQSDPTPSTSFLIENVERGTHTLEVATVGSNGKEIARSAKVTVYYMPPRTNMVKPPPKPKGKG